MILYSPKYKVLYIETAGSTSWWKARTLGSFNSRGLSPQEPTEDAYEIKYSKLFKKLYGNYVY
jgi:hypothetical protein